MKPLMTLERAREVFAYDSETGVITWARSAMHARAGVVAGHHSKALGYRTLWLDGRSYLAHRVAWLLAYGAWPIDSIDHINGDRSDNRLSNLRDTSRRVNNENRHGPQSNNTSGYLGVTFCKQTGRWIAQIVCDEQHRNLGRFHTPVEAHHAYLKAKRELHEGCTI